MSRLKNMKREEILELVKEGFSNSEIVELLGVPKKRVANVRWENNVKNGTVNPKLRPEKVVRWLMPKNARLPWKRVDGVRGKNGLVLCERPLDGTVSAVMMPVWKEAEVVKPKAVDIINRPPHYTKGGVEVIDFIEAKGLGYNLGNVVKYVSRVDDKDEPIENLEKAMWYLKREIMVRQNSLPESLRKQV